MGVREPHLCRHTCMFVQFSSAFMRACACVCSHFDVHACDVINVGSGHTYTYAKEKTNTHSHTYI